MTHEQLQQIRAIVYDAYCEGDTEAEWMLAVIDAALAANKAQDAQPVASDCTRIMREQGKAYPRTCPRCGLGPCAYQPTITVTPAQPCPDCGKTTAPDTVHTCSPQVREWVGLTREERLSAVQGTQGWVEVSLAIEAALRAKNTGEQA